MHFVGFQVGDDNNCELMKNFG